MGNFFAELKRRNVVRVAIAYIIVGWVTLQVVDVIAAIMKFPEWFAQVVLVLVGLGLPFAILLSWAYHITPDGFEKTPERNKAKKVPRGTRININKLIIGGLVLAVAFLLNDKFLQGPDQPEITVAVAGPVTIAVLPFADLSRARDQEYFGDGMAEEILNILARVEGLDVTSRTTAFSLKGKGLSIPEMADRLGVSHIVEGSIRRSGNRVRITAQLIKTDTDTHLWSETYDRELTDIFAIQDDISRSITNALQIELFGDGAIRKNPTDNLEAYRLYLQGRHLILQRGSTNLMLAIKLLKQAVELDPNFALAWADLAIGTLLIPPYTPSVDQQIYRDQATIAASRALELDPDLGIAVALRGMLLFHKGQWLDGLAAMKRALEIDPKNATIWLCYGVQLSTLGYMGESVNAVLRAYEIAPTIGNNAGWLAMIYSATGEREKAHRFADEAIGLGWGYAPAIKAELLLSEGDFEGAKQFYQAFLRNFNEPKNGLDIFVGAHQDPALRPKVRAVLAGYLQERRYYSSLYGALLLGEASLLVDYLENVSNNAVPELGFVAAPSYRKVLVEPVLKDYLVRQGLPEFWRENGWPDFCKPIGDDDFECESETPGSTPN